MGFFSKAESAQLAIQRMSLHIVGGEAEFVFRPELEVAHDGFLLQVLRAIAADPVHRFNEISTTRDTIQDIARGEIDFSEGAQVLAHQFHRLHDNGRTSEGAFLVFELAVDDPEMRFYALVKYDYRAVLELQHDAAAATLREIVEALVNDKSAVQKAAIVRACAGHVDAELATQDRMGRRPDLTAFFHRYLEASRARSDEELTSASRGAVTETIRVTKNQHGQNVAQAVARANEVLRNSPTITEEVIKNAVWVGAGMPENEQLCQDLSRATEREISRKRLADCEFTPDRTALPRVFKRRITTVEGITLTYGSDLDNTRVTRRAGEDGATIIIIETEGIVTDDVVANAAGRDPGLVERG